MNPAVLGLEHPPDLQEAPTHTKADRQTAGGKWDYVAVRAGPLGFRARDVVIVMGKAKVS